MGAFLCLQKVLQVLGRMCIRLLSSVRKVTLTYYVPEKGQPQKCLFQSTQTSATALMPTVTNMAFNIPLFHINCILLEFGVASSGAWHEATVATTINTKQAAMIQVLPGRSPKVSQIHTQTAQWGQAVALKLSLWDPTDKLASKLRDDGIGL